MLTFKRDKPPLLSIICYRKKLVYIVDYRVLAHSDCYRHAYRRFVSSTLGREMETISSGIELQTLLMYPIHLADGRYLRVSAISVDWCYGFLC